MSAPAAVEASAVVVRRGGRDVLDRISLRAEVGDVTAILGPNGAGKTTLLRCGTAMITPDAGEIRVLGAAPDAVATTGRIGVMPQSAGAWSGIRARELLDYLAGLYADPLPVDALLERLGLGSVARTPYRRLSGGQQQSLNLAAALVGRPELVFLDEPTAGLDPHARQTTWTLIEDLRRAGVSVVLTTHAMDEAERLADRVIMIDRGRTVLSGTVGELTAAGSSLEQVFLHHTTPVAP